VQAQSTIRDVIADSAIAQNTIRDVIADSAIAQSTIRDVIADSAIAQSTIHDVIADSAIAQSTKGKTSRLKEKQSLTELRALNNRRRVDETDFPAMYFHPDLSEPITNDLGLVLK
jgi:hypothetical protein